MTKAVHIDIVSDVVCPWCAIGYHQLRTVLDDLGMDAEIHWQPFQLNPDMGPEGQNLGEHLGEKYGITPEQSRQNRDHITAVGAELGFTFRFTEEMRMLNTHDAHQLIHWAALKGRDTEVKQAFQKAYFTDGLDVSDQDVLVKLVSDLGFDGDEARAILDDQRYDGAVREQMDFWRQQGINSVPAIIFERKYLVPGAAGVEQFRQVLSEVAKQQA
ncbi:DsbA family oxidoreductase [uncultured Cohaesibacter sp.]|uniref:DsbA family oxidoreductase n=1 Tax=uncultured Cohaesibacter sp. TaxID=1002546 RepID=UPI002AAA7E7D|nr:DsbA family oxidoreductase [uncultured Cohaesibacter sp.]